MSPDSVDSFTPKVTVRPEFPSEGMTCAHCLHSVDWHRVGDECSACAAELVYDADNGGMSGFVCSDFDF